MSKKLYYVRREVYARNIKEAMTAKGKIYSIEEAAEKDQPVLDTQITGFSTKKKKTS